MEENRDELYDTLINDSIRFLESLGHYYGAERAMQVWKELGPTVGEDVKGQVFMTMLSGNNHSMRLHLSRPSTMSNPAGYAVPVIKTIRAATGLGLKESKDLWDATAVETISLTCLSRQHAKDARLELQKIGMRAR
jgi:hypothetical protein